MTFDEASLGESQEPTWEVLNLVENTIITKTSVLVVQVKTLGGDENGELESLSYSKAMFDVQEPELWDVE